MATEAQTCAIGIVANRPNEQESNSPLHKPPILPNLPTIYNLFMQNKANFRKARMSANAFVTKDYENISHWRLPKNKPNSNPNKANLPEGKIDAMCVFTKDYEEKCG